MPRKDERVNFFKEIVLECSSGKREARIGDLSPGGCYVDSIVAVTEGEPVALSIRTSDGGTLEFSGEVAYVLQGMGFGVRFGELTDDQTSFLSSAIAESGG